MILCDNMATVAACGSNRAEDPLIRGALRELWWLTATRDVELTVRHKPGAEMIVPDMLSRVSLSRAHEAKLKQYMGHTVGKRLLVRNAALMPPINL